MASDLLFPTSVVGSLPRPDYVKDLISEEFAGSSDDYRRWMEAAIRSAVAMQECAGLDVITDTASS
jgi:5-methyltetrahydropteroyltriglutamate--homocysteine methyltransferase